MPRHISLRQIEAFKALMEHGTASRAAEVLNISQPAMSKLVAHLEFDTGLQLFDRVRGRLAPTQHALRLHDEVERVFAGVRQVESSVEAIRREEQGRLAIGVLPALAGSFIQQVNRGFLEKNPNVFCSVQALGSQLTIDRLVTRKLDVGLVDAGIQNPYVSLEPLMAHPLVCIMAPDHALTSKARVEPPDLDGCRFIAFNAESIAGHRIEQMLESVGTAPNIVMVSNVATTICEAVAAGVGVSLVHPLTVSGMEDRVAVRPFDPALEFSYQLSRSADSRNARFVDMFVDELQKTATKISQTILGRF